MYPFVESLRIENGQIRNIRYHNERMNRTRREILGKTDEINLTDHIPVQTYRKLTKCRVEYRENILKIEFHPYELREIHTLKIQECDNADYSYKSTDRQFLNELFNLREKCDDILIVRKGLITDTSACNVACYDGQDWYTPAHPLLLGTNRAFLSDQKIIKPRDISIKDISIYQRIRLFNAMIDFGQIELPIENIIF